jgi:hypothetical protein
MPWCLLFVIALMAISFVPRVRSRDGGWCKVDYEREEDGYPMYCGMPGEECEKTSCQIEETTSHTRIEEKCGRYAKCRCSTGWKANPASDVCNMEDWLIACIVLAVTVGPVIIVGMLCYGLEAIALGVTYTVLYILTSLVAGVAAGIDYFFGTNFYSRVRRADDSNNDAGITGAGDQRHRQPQQDQARPAVPPSAPDFQHGQHLHDAEAHLVEVEAIAIAVPVRTTK